MKNQVLIIRSNPIAPDPRVDKIASSLAKFGYQVSVLGWARKRGLADQEEINNYKINRIQILADYGAGLNNLPALLRWQWHELIWLVKNRHLFDYIHACDFDTVLPALICKYFYRKHLIYDIFDFYADHLRKTPSVIKKLIRWFDIKIINMADAVILVDKNRLSQIEGSKPKQLEYIYNTPIDVGSFMEMNESTSKLNIVYVGLLQEERGLFTLLELIKNHPDWKLELAGFGGDEKQIADLANSIPNVSFHSRVSYEEALYLGQKSDAFYALYDPNIPNHKYASPNKIFEAMMLGKPVVVAKNTNVDKLVDDIGCGVVVDYSSPADIESGLKSLEDAEKRKQLGKAGRAAYENTYNWQKMEERLHRLYKEVQ